MATLTPDLIDFCSVCGLILLSRFFIRCRGHTLLQCSNGWEDGRGVLEGEIGETRRENVKGGHRDLNPKALGPCSQDLGFPVVWFLTA